MTFSGYWIIMERSFPRAALGVGDGELGNKPVLDVDVLMLLRCCMCPYEAITVYSFPKYLYDLTLAGALYNEIRPRLLELGLLLALWRTVCSGTSFG
jgi:hypothetical protein